MRSFLIAFALCFSIFSFTLPTRAQFSKMNQEERTKLLTEIWDLRYEIMMKSNADDVVDEFFCLYYEMLLEDKELCLKENILDPW